MPDAARIQDPTGHPGAVGGPGVPTVVIGGRPVAVVGDLHACAFPSGSGHPPTAFLVGSRSVRVGGRGVLRRGDKAGCGAAIVGGDPSVVIGD